MATTPRVDRTRDELELRYKVWSATPPDCPRQREAAWHRYCDARDKLPDGESARRSMFVIPMPEDEDQLSLLDGTKAIDPKDNLHG